VLGAGRGQAATRPTAFGGGKGAIMGEKKKKKSLKAGKKKNEAKKKTGWEPAKGMEGKGVHRRNGCKSQKRRPNLEEGEKGGGGGKGKNRETKKKAR